MGRELTKRHSALFQSRLRSPLAFARDVYQYGKLRELTSFVAWELLHKLRLYPKARYLPFDAEPPFTLDRRASAPLASQPGLEGAFRARGLAVTRAAHDWKTLFLCPRGEIFGCVYPEDHVLYKSTDGGQSLQALERFPEGIKSIYVSSQHSVFVSVGGAVYRGRDDGRAFSRAFDFASTDSFFRHNNAMTETPTGTLIVGEYGNVWEGSRWRSLAYLYFSEDEGLTWHSSDFLIRAGANKHVHLVKYSKSLGKVFVADGDNLKKLWVSDASSAGELRDPSSWRAVNRFHIQMGGYTSIVDGDGKVVFGTDYQGGTNFIIETTDARSYAKTVVPDPYRRSPIDNMVRRNTLDGHEIWANLPYSTANSMGLLMYTADAGRSWRRLLQYSRSTHKVWLLSASTEGAAAVYVSVEDLRNADRVVYRIGG
jgi:hypothetical protein